MPQSTRQYNIKKGSRTPKGRLQRGSRLRYVRIPATLSLPHSISPLPPLCLSRSLAYTHAHADTDTERGSESPPTQQAARIAGRTHFINIDHFATVDSGLVLISPHPGTFLFIYAHAHAPPWHVSAVLRRHIRAAEQTRTSLLPRV